MMKRALSPVLTFPLVSIFLLSGIARGAAGDSDQTFNGTGLIVTAFGGSTANTPLTVITQSDDKILAAGGSAVVRRTADGEPDPTFGSFGVAPVSFFVLALAMQPDELPGDDKIIAVGIATRPGTGNDFGITRLLPNGSIDTSFGTGGLTAIDFFGSTDQVTTVTIQDDGKILVGGSTIEPGFPSAFALARLSADGEPDDDFGDMGRVATKIFSTTSDGVVGVAQLSDGTIVAGGRTRLFGFADFALVGYDEHGVVDMDFGTDGLTTTDFGAEDDATSMAIAPGDKIVLVGYAEVGLQTNFAIARYGSDGLPDEMFDTDGKISVDASGIADSDYAYGARVLADSSILVSGYTNTTASRDFALIKLLDGGGLDPNFGEAGSAMFDFIGTEDDVPRMALQSDGKIVLAGSTDASQLGTSLDFLLARFTAEGDVDTEFGDDGGVRIDILGRVRSRARDVLVRSDGRILAAGIAGDSFSSQNFAFVQFTGTGARDSEFGSMGMVQIDFDIQEDGAHAIAEDKDGKVIVVGLTREGESASNLGVVRLNQDGSLDTDFGDEGFVRTDINGLSDEALGVAIQDDDKIVVAGTAQTMEGTGDFVVARYDAEGVLDPDFGEAGIATIDFFGKQDFVADVEIQADGKIVVTGTADTGSGFDFAVARLTDMGDPDLEFSGDGEHTIDVGGTTNVATASAMHVGETILIGGHTNGSGSGDFAMVRLLPNGDPDDDFGDAGIVKTDVSGVQSRDQILDLTIQGDDKIVVTGCSGPVSCTDNQAVARYSVGGVPDATFSQDGFVTGNFGSTFVQGNGVAIQEDGAIVVAGERLGGGLVDFLVTRYQGDLPPVLCGDANASTTISAIDALVTLRTAVGTAQCLLCLCDANGSGAITASDSLLVLKKGVGQDVTMMCPAC